MAKPSKGKDQRPKSLKDQKKELEEKMFGEKNTAKKKEIQNLIKKLDISMKLENEKRKELEKTKKPCVVKQLIPVGVDPKDVSCINFANGNCNKGEKCQFSHVLKTAQRKEEKKDTQNKNKIVCRFLIDAMNNGENMKTWVCPYKNCRDIHKLIEIGDNSEIEISLEEYIELQKRSLDDFSGTPVTEESFKEWKEKKKREEELHAKRVSALSSSAKGIDMFIDEPGIFEDDEDAIDDINYNERNYADSEEEGEDGKNTE